MRTLFSLALVLSLSIPVLAQSLVRTAVSFDGKEPILVNSYYETRDPYIEIKSLASAMGWEIGRGDPRVIKLNGDQITDFKTYKRKRYVHAQKLADLLDCTLQIQQQGAVVEFWSKEILESEEKTQISVQVLNRRKLVGPGLTGRLIWLKFRVTNQGSEPIALTSRNFQIQDVDDKYYLCRYNFPVVIEPGQSSEPLELNFHVQGSPRFQRMVLKNDDDKVIYATRI